MSESVERLTAGLDSKQREALGDLAPLVNRLAAEPAPHSTPESRARLLAALEEHLQPTNETSLEWTESPPAQASYADLSRWLRMALAQARLFEGAFWLACALVAIPGMIAIRMDPGSGLAIFWILLAPVLASAGVAYAFRPATQTLSDLERITPTGPLALMYTRLGLALGSNLLVIFALLAAVWLRDPQILLWRLGLAWCGPMLLFAGLALYLTFRWGSLAGAIAPLATWGLLVLLGWWEMLRRGVDGFPRIDGLLDQVSRSDPFLVISLLAAFLGLIFLRQAGQLSERGLPAWH